MKAVKIYLIIVTILLCVAIGLGVYVWYVVQNLNSEGAGTTVQGTEAGTPTPNSKATASTALPSIESAEQPIIIKTADLPATQQKVLETVGITSGSITITPTMVRCAEDAVGKVRLLEIQKGSAPSPMESIKLIPCLKS